MEIGHFGQGYELIVLKIGGYEIVECIEKLQKFSALEKG